MRRYCERPGRDARCRFSRERLGIFRWLTRRGTWIALIGRLGHGLDAAVRKPALGLLLKLSRLPARAAGLGELQSFLERGFAAFATLDRPAAFVDGVVARELEVSRRLFAGTPDPFGSTGLVDPKVQPSSRSR